MTQSLSAEEIAELRKNSERAFKTARDGGPDMVWTSSDTMESLLAMASRLVELESALVFIADWQDKTRRIITVGHPDEVLGSARELGWPGPTSQAKWG